MKLKLSPLNKPKIRSFLVVLLENFSKISEFHNNSLENKEEILQNCLKTIQNPILSLFKQYTYKNFLSDCISDIVYNLKNMNVIDFEINQRICDFFAIFYDFSYIEMDYLENNGNISFDFNLNSNSFMIELLIFIEKELIDIDIKSFISQISNFLEILLNFSAFAIKITNNLEGKYWNFIDIVSGILNKLLNQEKINNMSKIFENLEISNCYLELLINENYNFKNFLIENIEFIRINEIILGINWLKNENRIEKILKKYVKLIDFKDFCNFLIVLKLAYKIKNFSFSIEIEEKFFDNLTELIEKYKTDIFNIKEICIKNLEIVEFFSIQNFQNLFNFTIKNLYILLESEPEINYLSEILSKIRVIIYENPNYLLNNDIIIKEIIKLLTKTSIINSRIIFALVLFILTETQNSNIIFLSNTIENLTSIYFCIENEEILIFLLSDILKFFEFYSSKINFEIFINSFKNLIDIFNKEIEKINSNTKIIKILQKNLKIIIRENKQFLIEIQKYNNFLKILENKKSNKLFCFLIREEIKQKNDKNLFFEIFKNLIFEKNIDFLDIAFNLSEKVSKINKNLGKEIFSYIKIIFLNICKENSIEKITIFLESFNNVLSKNGKFIKKIVKSNEFQRIFYSNIIKFSNNIEKSLNLSFVPNTQILKTACFLKGIIQFTNFDKFTFINILKNLQKYSHNSLIISKIPILQEVYLRKSIEESYGFIDFFERKSLKCLINLIEQNDFVLLYDNIIKQFLKSVFSPSNFCFFTNNFSNFTIIIPEIVSNPIKTMIFWLKIKGKVNIFSLFEFYESNLMGVKFSIKIKDSQIIYENNEYNINSDEWLFCRVSIGEINEFYIENNCIGKLNDLNLIGKHLQCLIKGFEDNNNDDSCVLLSSIYIFNIKLKENDINNIRFLSFKNNNILFEENLSKIDIPCYELKIDAREIYPQKINKSETFSLLNPALFQHLRSIYSLNCYKINDGIFFSDKIYKKIHLNSNSLLNSAYQTPFINELLGLMANKTHLIKNISSFILKLSFFDENIKNIIKKKFNIFLNLLINFSDEIDESFIQLFFGFWTFENNIKELMCNDLFYLEEFLDCKFFEKTNKNFKKGFFQFFIDKILIEKNQTVLTNLSIFQKLLDLIINNYFHNVNELIGEIIFLILSFAKENDNFLILEVLNLLEISFLTEKNQISFRKKPKISEEIKFKLLKIVYKTLKNDCLISKTLTISHIANIINGNFEKLEKNKQNHKIILKIIIFIMIRNQKITLSDHDFNIYLQPFCLNQLLYEKSFVFIQENDILRSNFLLKCLLQALIIIKKLLPNEKIKEFFLSKEIQSQIDNIMPLIKEAGIITTGISSIQFIEEQTMKICEKMRKFSSFSNQFPEFEVFTQTISDIIMENIRINEQLSRNSISIERLLLQQSDFLSNLMSKTDKNNVFLLEKTMLILQSSLNKDLVLHLFMRSWELYTQISFWSDFSIERFKILSGFLMKMMSKMIFNAKIEDLKWGLKVLCDWLERYTIEIRNKQSKSSLLKRLFTFNEKENEGKDIVDRISVFIKVFAALVFRAEIDNNGKIEIIKILIEKNELWMDKKEERIEFIASLIYLLWNEVSNLEKEIRDLAIRLLQKIICFYNRDTLLKILVFYDVNALDKGFDFLWRLKESNKIQPIDFIIFTSQKEVHSRIEMVLNKKLYVYFVDYFSNLLQERSLEENYLIYSDEIKFFEANLNAKLKSQLSIPTQIQQTFLQIEKTLYAIYVRNQLKFFKNQKIQSKSKNFSLKTSDNTHWELCSAGLSVFQRNLLIKKTGDISTCFLTDSPIEKIDKSSSISHKTSETSELTDNFLINMSSNNSFVTRFPNKNDRINSSVFQIFLVDNGIFEKIIDYYPIAIIKQREYFLEALIFFGIDNFYIVLNAGINSQKLPIFLGNNNPINKAKYILKKAPYNSLQYRKKSEFDLNLPIKKQLIIIKKFDIIEIRTKRFWLKPCGIEILTNKKSYFLIINQYKKDKFLDHLLMSINSTIPSVSNQKSLLFIVFNQLKYYKALDFQENQKNISIYSSNEILKPFCNLWEQGKISNFDYLMLLNILSGRTFADLSQYPVLPWVLGNFEGEIDLLNPLNYRDFSKPIGALKEERAKLAEEKFKNSQEENSMFPPFHYGSHYSSAVLVLYYLIRALPFAKYCIKLQGGRFDLSDRLYHNFPETWLLANSVDYKEFIPELLNFPELFLNVNKFDFGYTQGKELVNDVILPEFSHQDPRYFSLFLRKALESSYCSSQIHKWIDLIFGFKQKGKPGIESLNIFYFLTYEDAMDFEKCRDCNEINACLDQINEYGQTPRQLFVKPHIQKKLIQKNLIFCYDLKRLNCLKPEINEKNINGKIEIVNKALFFIKGKNQYNGLNCIESELILINTVKDIAKTSNITIDNFNFMEIVNDNEVLLYPENSLESIFLGKSEKNNEKITLEWQSDLNYFEIKEGNSLSTKFIKEFSNISKTNFNIYSKNLIIGSDLGLISVYEIILNKNDERKIENNKKLIKKQKNNEKNWDILIKGNLYGHWNKIINLETIRNLLISGDNKGNICQWDLEKCDLLRKISIKHFSEEEIFKNTYFNFETEIPENIEIRIENVYLPTEYIKEEERQKIRSISLIENGDFVIVSKDYFSLYSINGVLLAIEYRKNWNFTTILLIKNFVSFEDYYIITGNKKGIISIYILDLKKIKNSSSKNLYTDHYINNYENNHKLYRFPTPYSFKNIYELNIYDFYKDIDFGAIKQIFTSIDQSKLFVLYQNGQLISWNYKENYIDKKTQCCECGNNNMEFDTIKPEISLRKNVRICKKCWEIKLYKKNTTLYDNY